MEEKDKTGKRKIDGASDIDNYDGLYKKQKTDDKKQDDRIIFLAKESDRARNKLFEGKPNESWVIRESETKKGLFVVGYLKKDKVHGLIINSIRYMYTSNGWKGCTSVEKENLKGEIKPMIPLDCKAAENHIESFYEKVKPKGFKLENLIKPTFFSSPSGSQEEKQPEKIDEKTSGLRLSHG